MNWLVTATSGPPDVIVQFDTCSVGHQMFQRGLANVSLECYEQEKVDGK